MPVLKFEAVTTVTDEDNFFTPLAVLQNAVRFWWFVFLLMFAGGMVGWLAHHSRPPVYEAVAQFSGSIDYVSTGPLTQYEEDVALNAIGEILYSTDIIEAVVEQASALGIQTSLADLLGSSVLERKFTTYDLRVRGDDPQTAEQLANLWVEQGQSVLLKSYQHALQADRLHRYLLSLENCLAQTAVSEPAGPLCSQYRFSDIQQDLTEAGSAYSQERLASRGMFSGLVLGPVERAIVSTKPVLYDRNQLVLAGALVGLLIGMICIQLGIPANWFKRR